MKLAGLGRFLENNLSVFPNRLGNADMTNNRKYGVNYILRDILLSKLLLYFRLIDNN